MRGGALDFISKFPKTLQVHAFFSVFFPVCPHPPVILAGKKVDAGHSISPRTAAQSSRTYSRLREAGHRRERERREHVQQYERRTHVPAT